MLAYSAFMIKITETDDYTQQTCSYELTTATIYDHLIFYIFSTYQWKRYIPDESDHLKPQIIKFIYGDYGHIHCSQMRLITYVYSRLIPTQKKKCRTEKMSFNYKKHLSGGVFNNMISKTVFKDSNVISWKILHVNIEANHRRNYQKRTISKHSFEIRLYPNTGKIAVLRSGRLSIHLSDINKALKQFARVKDEMEYYYNKATADDWFKEINDLMAFPDVDNYYILRNSDINNLEIPFYIKLSLYGEYDNGHDRVNLRRRISYISKNKKLTEGHKSKLVNDALLFKINFPKSIRKILLTYPLQSENALLKIHEKIPMLGVNKIKILLETYLKKIETSGLKIKGMTLEKADYYYPDLSIIGYLMDFLDIGFSFEKILNFFKKEKLNSTYYIRDSLRIINTLNTNEYEFTLPQANSFENLHDALTTIQQNMYALQNAKRQKLLFVPHESKFESEALGEYTIRPIVNLHELISIGDKMSHCVASYIPYVQSKQVEILVITKQHKDGEKYVVCLELIPSTSRRKKTTLVQAKLNGNRLLSIMPDLNNAVVEWAKGKKINIKTSDIKIMDK